MYAKENLGFSPCASATLTSWKPWGVSLPMPATMPAETPATRRKARRSSRFRPSKKASRSA